jgi:AraC family transcriptional regulator, activator of mtrCDE
MDALSRLVSLLDLKGRLDLRCLFGQQWQAPHEAIGPWRAPYHIALRGECEVWLPRQRERITLSQGSLLILPRGAAHTLRAGAAAAPGPIRQRPGAVVELKTNLARPAQAEVDILCGELEFGGRRRSALLEALPECLLVRFSGRPESPWLESLVRLMEHEVAQHQPGATAIVAELSGLLFTLAVRAHLETQPQLGGVLGVLAHPRLAPALQLMLEQPQRPWTVASLAQRCNLSRASFAREFQRSAGVGPLQLLTALRMELAAQLLARGGQDTAGVGEAVGYRSEAAFNRAFARFAGVTPGRYRRGRSTSGNNPANRPIAGRKAHSR